MNLSNKAIKFFLCGDKPIQDFYKLCEAADNDASIPEDIEVIEPFNGLDAQLLVDNIFELKALLVEVKEKTIFKLKFL